MAKNDSPCTSVCQYDPRQTWCAGCGRTAEEIKTWRKLSPFYRTRLVEELKRRMAKLQK